MGLSSFCALDLQSDVGKFGLSWLYNMSQGISPEDGISYLKQFEKMTNRELDKILELTDTYSSDVDIVDHFQKMYEHQMMDDYDLKSTFLSSMPVVGTFPDKHKKDSLQNIMVSRGATDRVYLDMGAFQKLFYLWQNHNHGSFLHHIPIDLSLSQKIQIPDLEICLTNVDPKYTNKELIVRVRFLVSECSIVSDSKSVDKTEDDSEKEKQDAKYCWHSVSEPDPFPVGLIDIPLSEDGLSGYITTFGILPGLNQMLLYGIPCVYGLSDEKWNELTNGISFGDCIQVTTFFLQVWYTMQVALNSNVLKKLFEHPVRQKDRRKSLSGIKCTKITRPIKIHKITEDMVDDLLSSKLGDKYELQYLVGGWRYVNESGLFDEDCNILLIPSGWYQFNKIVSEPIDWPSVQDSFAKLLYDKVKGDSDFTMDEASVTKLLLDLIGDDGCGEESESRKSESDNVK